jgi:hypothetical protein
MALMDQHLEQQIQQADNPVMREQLRGMLQQIRQSKTQGNGNRP